MELAGLINAPPGSLLSTDPEGPDSAHWIYPLPESVPGLGADSDGPDSATGFTTCRKTLPA